MAKPEATLTDSIVSNITHFETSHVNGSLDIVLTATGTLSINSLAFGGRNAEINLQGMNVNFIFAPENIDEMIKGLRHAKKCGIACMKELSKPCAKHAETPSKGYRTSTKEGETPSRRQA